MASKINKAVEWAIKIANDDSHGYSQDDRWGIHYDCSSFVISAYEQAGVPVKSGGATTTANIVSVFLKNGFEDVTSSINLSSGAGTKKGDVLVNTVYHAALVREDGGAIVHASGQTNGICLRNWYNRPWNHVLRYKNDSGNVSYTAFPRYQLSESAINDIATCITGETGGSDILACRQEASQMVNLNEVTYGKSSTESSIIKTIHGGWYASSSWSRGCTQTAMDAVKFVMIEGKRVLPRYVTEHDYFPEDAWNNTFQNDRSQYTKNNTTVHQRPKHGKFGFANPTNYKFYCFFGKDGSGDIAGYFQKDYDKYQSDIAWSENLGSNNSSDSIEKVYNFTDTNEKISLHPTLFNQSIITVENGLNIFISTPSQQTINYNITNYCGSVEWHNSVSELATSMSFSVANAQQDWQNYYTPQCGDVVRIYTNREIFRGVIMNVDDSDPKFNKFNCYDAGWYLNKSEDTYQFYNITARECIRKILADLSIPVDSISESDNTLDSTTITNMYIDKKISDILKDILNQLPGKYNFDFTPRGFRLYQCGSEIVYPEFAVSGNTAKHDSIKYRSPETHSVSFEDINTAVKIISDTDVIATAKNDSAYNDFGFIQKVIKINPEEVSDPVLYAENELKRLEQPKETYSFEIIESSDSYTRAGQAIVIDGYKFNIVNTDHVVLGEIHRTKLDIERLGIYE